MFNHKLPFTNKWIDCVAVLLFDHDCYNYSSVSTRGPWPEPGPQDQLQSGSLLDSKINIKKYHYTKNVIFISFYPSVRRPTCTDKYNWWGHCPPHQPPWYSLIQRPTQAISESVLCVYKHTEVWKDG